METQTGTIVRIMRTKGYGFIQKEDGAIVFFHALAVISPTFQELREGLPVEFLVSTDPHGRRRGIGVVAAG